MIIVLIPFIALVLLSAQSHQDGDAPVGVVIVLVWAFLIALWAATFGRDSE